MKLGEVVVDYGDDPEPLPPLRQVIEGIVEFVRELPSFDSPRRWEVGFLGGAEWRKTFTLRTYVEFDCAEALRPYVDSGEAVRLTLVDDSWTVEPLERI